jgi:hypothetical protein
MITLSKNDFIFDWKNNKDLDSYIDAQNHINSIIEDILDNVQSNSRIATATLDGLIEYEFQAGQPYNIESMDRRDDETDSEYTERIGAIIDIRRRNMATWYDFTYDNTETYWRYYLDLLLGIGNYNLNIDGEPGIITLITNSVVGPSLTSMAVRQISLLKPADFVMATDSNIVYRMRMIYRINSRYEWWNYLLTGDKNLPEDPRLNLSPTGGYYILNNEEMTVPHGNTDPFYSMQDWEGETILANIETTPFFRMTMLEALTDKIEYIRVFGSLGDHAEIYKTDLSYSVNEREDTLMISWTVTGNALVEDTNNIVRVEIYGSKQGVNELMLTAPTVYKTYHNTETPQYITIQIL